MNSRLHDACTAKATGFSKTHRAQPYMLQSPAAGSSQAGTGSAAAEAECIAVRPACLRDFAFSSEKDVLYSAEPARLRRPYPFTESGAPAARPTPVQAFSAHVQSFSRIFIIHAFGTFVKITFGKFA